MKIQSLKFTVNPGDSHPLKTDLGVGSPQEFEKIREVAMPVAYLVQIEHLARLREFGDLTVDRGTKNKHKGLSEYLFKGDKKIPLIDGNFSDPKQLKRGVRTLLSNAEEKGERNVYIIGAEKAVYDEIWNNAHDEIKGKTGEKDEEGKKSYPDISSADETACELLNDLVERCKVPPELEDAFVGMSWKVDLVRKFIMLAAKRRLPVLILGDTGTGKEIVARKIHDYGRRDEPYQVINCGSIPTELFEAELFGYEPNCFTGAGNKVKKGLWELAGNGTLFLDEIGELRPDHQVKILRALSNGTIRRLCGTEDIKVHARVVAATNRDLSSMVQKGQFREDLYYRLRGFLIHTPALKDHSEDIPLLANYFWHKITNYEKAKGGQLSLNKRLPQAIMEELRLYRWPGNVRELKMVLNHLYSMFGADGLQEKHLKYVFYIQGQSWSTQTGPTYERSADLLIGDCWRHLRRADDVIRTLKYTLLSVMEGEKTDGTAVASARTYLGFHLEELTILCREHMLFHSEKTFSLVLKFKEKLAYFHDLLHQNISKAKEYWKETLTEEFETVLSSIFKEVERVLGKG